jgi:hypothetical protein
MTKSRKVRLAEHVARMGALGVSMACYRDSFTFLNFCFVTPPL